jgi:hypothetical protein
MEHTGECGYTSCLNKKDGCGWLGEYRKLGPHLDRECEFTLVACPNMGCTYQAWRSAMRAHAVDPQACVEFRLLEEAKARKRFDAITERHNLPSDELMRLNMGGESFVVGKPSLCIGGPSYLSYIATLAPEALKTVNGEYFFDLDPDHFRKVLSFQRNGKVPTFTPELYKFAEYLALSPLVAALADKALCETGEELALQDRRPEAAAVASLAIKATCGGRTVRLHVDPDSPFEELCAAIRDSLGLDDKDVDLSFKDDEDELCVFSKGTLSDALIIAASLRPSILHIVLKPIRERCVHCHASVAALGLMCSLHRSPLASGMGCKCSLVPPSTPAPDPPVFVDGIGSGCSSGSTSEPRHGVG